MVSAALWDSTQGNVCIWPHTPLWEPGSSPPPDQHVLLEQGPSILLTNPVQSLCNRSPVQLLPTASASKPLPSMSSCNSDTGQWLRWLPLIFFFKSVSRHAAIFWPLVQLANTSSMRSAYFFFLTRFSQLQGAKWNPTQRGCIPLLKLKFVSQHEPRVELHQAVFKVKH